MAVKSINAKKKPYYQRTANRVTQQLTKVVPKLTDVTKSA